MYAMMVLRVNKPTGGGSLDQNACPAASRLAA
jgi:hypothetical protein